VEGAGVGVLGGIDCEKELGCKGLVILPSMRGVCYLVLRNAITISLKFGLLVHRCVCVCWVVIASGSGKICKTAKGLGASNNHNPDLPLSACLVKFLALRTVTENPWTFLGIFGGKCLIWRWIEPRTI
jgi:hypothetical protein